MSWNLNLVQLIAKSKKIQPSSQTEETEICTSLSLNAQHLSRTVHLLNCAIGVTHQGLEEKASVKPNPQTLCGAALFNWPLFIKLPDAERHSLSVSVWKLCSVYLEHYSQSLSCSVFLFYKSWQQEIEGLQVCSPEWTGICVCASETKNWKVCQFRKQQAP